MTMLYKIWYKLCPYCKNEIKELAKKCQYCKKMVTKICPLCKSEIPINAKKCKVCGERIDEQARTENIKGENFTVKENKKETSKKCKFWCLKHFIVIVFIIIAIIIWWRYYNKYLAKSQLTDIAFSTLERIENFTYTKNITYKNDFLNDYNECISIKTQYISNEEKIKLNCLYNLSSSYAMFCWIDAIKNGKSGNYYNKDDVCWEFDYLSDWFLDTKKEYPESFNSWIY